jgi:Papain family cysteine protease
MESAYAIKFNQTPEHMSVQYLVDCDPVNFGCGGGWMLDAYEYTRTHGLVKEDDYSSHYSARKDACKDTTGKAHINNNEQKEEDSISVERLKELVSAQPLGVAMHSNPKCLMGYHSGVIRDADCSCSHPETATVNHAVTIVGYGKNTQNN